jgi:signal transduction histidine kinase
MAADRPSLARRLRPRSVRVRTTLAAVVVVGLALAVGAVALVVTMRVVLTNEVRNAARLRATDLAATLDAPGGRLPDLGTDDDLAIQVLDGTEVVASGGVAPRDRPLAELAPGASTQVDVPVEDDDFLAVAAAADDRVVLVARTLDDVDESTGIVAVLLTAGIPVLLLVVGATTWRLTGRALAPVEAIRTEVEAISGTELHRRVPVPPGGDEIARLASTMNAMLDRLDASATRQRRFVADASHELRSPVTTLRAHAEATMAAPARVSAPELAEVVLAEALRLQGLVDDLLLLARADERGATAGARPLDLDDLVFEEAARLRGGRQVQVDTSGVSGGRVAGDPATLRRVVRNLADNAVRHAGSRVAFSLRTEDGAVRLAVDDDGAGIPVAERERVFERFVRLDEARARDGGGAGLGLAIVREVVAAAGGTSRATTSPLGGARLEVELPALGDAPVQGGFRAPVPGSEPFPAPEEVP